VPMHAKRRIDVRKDVVNTDGGKYEEDKGRFSGIWEKSIVDFH